MGAYVPEDPEKGIIIVSEMLHGDMATMLKVSSRSGGGGAL